MGINHCGMDTKKPLVAASFVPHIYFSAAKESIISETRKYFADFLISVPRLALDGRVISYYFQNKKGRK